MKSIYITSLCATLISLSACNQQPKDTTKPVEQTPVATNTAPTPAAPAPLSTNNNDDIKSDFETLRQLVQSSLANEQKIGQTLQQATDSKSETKLKDAVNTLKQHYVSLTSQLKQLTLKSKEMTALRDKMAASTDYSAQLLDLELKNPKPTDAVKKQHAEIGKKLAALQTEINQEADKWGKKLGFEPAPTAAAQQQTTPAPTNKQTAPTLSKADATIQQDLIQMSGLINQASAKEATIHAEFEKANKAKDAKKLTQLRSELRKNNQTMAQDLTKLPLNTTEAKSIRTKMLKGYEINAQLLDLQDKMGQKPTAQQIEQLKKLDETGNTLKQEIMNDVAKLTARFQPKTDAKK